MADGSLNKIDAPPPSRSEEPKEKQEPAAIVDTELLEEDDDFEEFQDDNWEEPVPRPEDELQWEDNWDDEEDDGEFAKRLRAELERADRENAAENAMS